MAELPALSISPEKAYFIVAKARQFDVKDGVTDPDSGSNASDDGMRSVLEYRADDPVRTELVSFIHDLNDYEQTINLGSGDRSRWLGREPLQYGHDLPIADLPEVTIEIADSSE